MNNGYFAALSFFIFLKQPVKLLHFLHFDLFSVGLFTVHIGFISRIYDVKIKYCLHKNKISLLICFQVSVRVGYHF